MENENYNFEKICRCCLEETDDLKSLHTECKISGYSITMKNVLESFTPLSICENDNLPQKICYKCVVDAGRSYVFRNTCVQSDTTLREYHKCDDEQVESVKTGNEIVVEEINPQSFYFYDLVDEEGVGAADGEEGNDNSSENENFEKDVENWENENSTKSNNDSKYIEEDNNGDFDQLINEVEKNETLNLELNFNYPNANETINDCGDNISKSCETDKSSNQQLSEENKINSKRRQSKKRKSIDPTYKCEDCGKVLSTHSSYNYHKQLHSEKTPFLCNECGQGFKTRNAYHGHMTIHSGGHDCKVCGKTYRQIASLKSHMLLHTGKRPYVCGICGKGMTQKSGYKRHMLVHTDQKPYHCETCNKKFRYSSNLFAHKKIHCKNNSSDKPPLFNCQKCNKVFNKKTTFDKHMNLHSPEQIMEVFDNKDLNIESTSLYSLNTSEYAVADEINHYKLYNCQECDKVFNKKENYDIHMELHSPKKQIQIIINNDLNIESTCLKSTLEYAEENNEESQNVHENEEEEDEEEECDIIEIYEDIDESTEHPESLKNKINNNNISENTIDKSEVNTINISMPEKIKKNSENIIKNKSLAEKLKKFVKRNLKSKNVLDGPSYKCEDCGKVLSTQSSFNYHKQLHSDKTPFVCSECGQGFKTRNSYIGHMTTHNVGGHQCNICGNKYRQIGSLKSHMLMHSGERPFVCGVCGKGMTQKSGYKRHMLTHTGEKMFKCDICEKEFRYSSNLIVHKKIHCKEVSSDKPPLFNCQKCNKVFSSKSILIVHMQSHKVKRDCGICGKTFSTVRHLNLHLKIHCDDNEISTVAEIQETKSNSL